MRQTATVVVAALLAVSALGMPAAAAVGNTDLTASATVQEANETNNSSVAPGERLSGIIGVQEAEIEGEVEERAFGIAVARAANASQRAEAVLAQINQSRDRLDELRSERAALERARENGSMSAGQYRARLAVLAQRTENVKELTAQTSNVSEGLPADLLRKKGINVSAIRTLSEEAEELSGPKVAAVARSIAGGPDGEVEEYDAPNASEAIAYAERRVESARERLNATAALVNETNASENATAALAEAREKLRKAEQALEDARNASAAGNEERARELADQAADAARESVDEAVDAAEEARERGAERGPDRDDKAETPEKSDRETSTPEDGKQDTSTPEDGKQDTSTPEGGGNSTETETATPTEDGQATETSDGGSRETSTGGR